METTDVKGQKDQPVEDTAMSTLSTPPSTSTAAADDRYKDMTRTAAGAEDVGVSSVAALISATVQDTPDLECNPNENLILESKQPEFIPLSSNDHHRPATCRATTESKSGIAGVQDDQCGRNTAAPQYTINPIAPDISPDSLPVPEDLSQEKANHFKKLRPLFVSAFAEYRTSYDQIVLAWQDFVQMRTLNFDVMQEIIGIYKEADDFLEKFQEIEKGEIYLCDASRFITTCLNMDPVIAHYSDAAIAGITEYEDEFKLLQKILNRLQGSDPLRLVTAYELIGKHKCERHQYREGSLFFEKALECLVHLNSKRAQDLIRCKFTAVFRALIQTYLALAFQTRSLEPFKSVIGVLNNAMVLNPYEKLYWYLRAIYWRMLGNRASAMIDLLTYFCSKTNTKYEDVPVNKFPQPVLDDFESIVENERSEIDEYAQSLRPFLSQDFINLWLACDCNDPLVEDIWNVRKEQFDALAADVAPLQESGYKEALKALSSGQFSTVIEILQAAIENDIYNCEAALLLALAHSRLQGSIVDGYLDRFLDFWDQKQQQYSAQRRKQLIVRYGSLSRAIRADPFGGQNLGGLTKEMDANLYLQEALVVFWRRTNPDIGTAIRKREFREDNMRNLQIINRLCDLALQAVPEHKHAKIFKLRAVVELEMATNCSMLPSASLKPLESLVNEHNNTSKYSAFGDLCLYSVYLANLMDAEAKTRCTQMIDSLFMRGQPVAFLIKNGWLAGDPQTLTRLQLLLKNEPENHCAHVLMHLYDRNRGQLTDAYLHADNAIKCWPLHVCADDLMPTIREFVLLRILHGVKTELDLAEQRLAKLNDSDETAAASEEKPPMEAVVSASGNLEGTPNKSQSCSAQELSGDCQQEFDDIKKFAFYWTEIWLQGSGVSRMPKKDRATICPEDPGVSGISAKNEQTERLLYASRKVQEMIGAVFEEAEQLLNAGELSNEELRKMNEKLAEIKITSPTGQISDLDKSEESSEGENRENPKNSGNFFGQRKIKKKKKKKKRNR